MPLPTFIYISGNGVTALWQIENAPKLMNAAAVARYKAVNVGLIEALGGKKAGYDYCQNIDRLARLPYTLNLPDKRKRAKGRKEELAGNVEHHPNGTYTEFDFPTIDAPPLAPQSFEIGTPIYTDDLADLAATNRVKAIIRNGRVEGETKEPDDSRSAWEAEVVCTMVREGIAPEVILGVLLDERYNISERVLERGDQAELYARKEIERLRQRVLASIIDDFDSDVPEARAAEDVAHKPPRIITPTVFTWRDPSAIPQRPWLYMPAYIRGFPGLTIAPGGLGKSSLIIAESLAMVSNRPLLGVLPNESEFQVDEVGLRVWYWNGEDPREELERRISGAMKHYDVKDSDIDDRLFVDSGRNLPIRIADTAKSEVRIAIPLVNAVVEAIRDHRIDVLIIDPFVSSHSVSENDNVAIDRVAKQWSDIADKTGCHIHWVHHNRKAREGSGASTIEDARGASSLRDAARTRRVLNRMTETQAKSAGLITGAHRSYFFSDPDTSSMIRPAHAHEWYEIVSVNLGNGDVGDGDEVGVVTPWDHPAAEPPGGRGRTV